MHDLTCNTVIAASCLSMRLSLRSRLGHQWNIPVESYLKIYSKYIFIVPYFSAKICTLGSNWKDCKAVPSSNSRSFSICGINGSTQVVLGVEMLAMKSFAIRGLENNFVIIIGLLCDTAIWSTIYDNCEYREMLHVARKLQWLFRLVANRNVQAVCIGVQGGG